MSVAFDTLRLARTLRDKANSPEQAEGVADAMAESMQGDLATKAEVLAVRTDLRAELREVELSLEARIEVTKADLIKWVVGMIGFQTIVLLGAAPALARAFTK